MKLYLRAVVLILVAYVGTGCLGELQSVSSRGPVGQDEANNRSMGRTPSGADVRLGGNRRPLDLKSQAQARGRESSTAYANGGQGKTSQNAQDILDEALEFCQTSQDFWGQGDFENAVDALDQAYNLILSAGTNDNAKLIQQKEDIRFMICKRMLEIYASQHIVANGSYDAIPMVMNRYVRKEIKGFQGPERKFFISSYKRSGRYRPEILRALREAGLPKELSWLPLIESGFKVNALSRARALGLWQFIPSTGYKYGLKRDEWIDERMDVTKSTHAAIAYLKELHDIFGDWMTVLAGYNCGEARVLRVIRSQNINYLDNFWDVFEKLPWETARYVPRFLAARFIINDPEKYGFKLKDLDPPHSYEKLTVSKQMRLKDVGKALGIFDKDLEYLNAELRHKATPPHSYDLKVHKGKGALLVSKLDRIPVWTPPQRLYAYHRVRRGETLSHLAERYRTSVRAIASANNISRRSLIRVGQRLKIPSRGGARTYAKARKMNLSGPKPGYHRVKRGDSLWLLARRYNTNTKEIMRLNNLKTTRLHIGQRLIIRKGTDAVPTGVNTKTYRVKAGDSPYEIARAHNMRLERFLRVNNLTPRSKIYPGQVLEVQVK
jgi:membrane-bound lytic murein transglycosylase D